MNTHKNANKQGEKILLGGVAAAALGLINAKPQTVKAANQNGTRATKSAAGRPVKTKLNYQSETGSETEGAAADYSGTNIDETANNNPEDGQSEASTNNSIASETNQDVVINNEKADKHLAKPDQFNSAKVTRDGNTSISSTWNGIPVNFFNGKLAIGETNQDYSITINKKNPFAIDNVVTDDITEIDINAPIAITGTAQRLFSKLNNLVSIEGLKNLNTSQITNFSYMFADCPKLTTLDLSNFDTAKATSYSSMFSGDTTLTSVDLSNFTVTDNALTFNMFDSCSNLTKLNLGKGFKFTNYKDTKNNSLEQPGTWVNMGEGNGSLAKGTNQWSSADLMTNYQGDRDHDTYVRYTGGIVTVHRQDEEGKQLVDQDGKEIPDEKLFGNISDSVTIDTSKEFAGYKFKENKNSDIKAFISDPQTITLVYSTSTTDNTWEGVPFTFNNGVLSLGENGKTYPIDNSGNKERIYALDTRDISISQNIKGVNVDEIKEIDLNANIKIKGSANGLFKNLKNLATIKGLSNLDTSQVTNMEQMFSNCPKLTALDLSSLNTDNVVSYSSMFSGDTALTSVDLSSFKVAANTEVKDMFNSCSSLTKLTLGKDFKFTTPDNQPNNSLQQSGTWVNMGAGEGSPAKGTKKWTSAELMTKYQGSTDHDTYKLFTNLGGIVTVHRQDEQGNQIVPDEELFGNISDPVTVDTSKEFAGYTFKENKNPTVTAFISDPQDITLVYTKKTGTGSNGSGSNGSSSNGSGNSTPNTSVPNNTNSSSGNNGSVNNPSSSNSQGSNSQGSNTGNSNNNSSSGSNGQNNGNNLPNNEPHNIPSPVNRKPKTVRPHKTINKGFNIKDQNAIHNQQLANSLKNNGSSSNAQNNASNTLPQTGNDKHNSLAMLALGSLALATALGAAWFGRKKY